MTKRLCMINSLESQAEYVKALQHGYAYARHGNVSLYRFSQTQMEPTIREKLPIASWYVWVFHGCTMASCEHADEFTIVPCDTPIEWMRVGDAAAVERGWA